MHTELYFTIVLFFWALLIHKHTAWSKHRSLVSEYIDILKLVNVKSLI